MKYLHDCETDEYVLEVIECDCGFHLGLDSTYLGQVEYIQIECPSCTALIDTKILDMEAKR